MYGGVPRPVIKWAPEVWSPVGNAHSREIGSRQCSLGWNRLPYAKWHSADISVWFSQVNFTHKTKIGVYLRHWKTNQVLSVDTFNDVSDPRHHTTRFHRGHLHGALLKHVPRESIHLNKKIARAESNEKEVELYFEDGTSVHGDILIGADGIKSVGLYLICKSDSHHWTNSVESSTVIQSKL